MGKVTASGAGMPNLPIVFIPHPVNALPAEDMSPIVDKALPEIVRRLTSPVAVAVKEEAPEKKRIFRSEQTLEAGSLEAINRDLYELGWTDGLPIIPPTRAAVERMLAFTDRDPNEVIATLPPRGGQATVEKIAINAVMAGCVPEFLPVVVAAVQALGEEREMNLRGIISTTNPTTVALMVNGPIARELDINSGLDCFGSGWRANAAIGRAVRLVILNIAGGAPAIVDKSTQGQPGKYSFCFAENEEASPWDPLHVERGLPRGSSAVSVFSPQGLVPVSEFASQTGKGVLVTIANTMAYPGSIGILRSSPDPASQEAGRPAVILPPEFAEMAAKDGLSKDAVKQFLWARAEIPYTAIGGEYETGRKFRGEGNEILKVAPRADEIMIAVAGGPGRQAAYFPNFTRPVTKAVARRDGTPVKSVYDFKK
ncbi:MAG: hypothetical protein HYX92_05160 [Chloroflexi bacterium]|nr:hypothetical protein [Chloroflexota bacterium]